jgi:hypothetical protein
MATKIFRSPMWSSRLDMLITLLAYPSWVCRSWRKLSEHSTQWLFHTGNKVTVLETEGWKTGSGNLFSSSYYTTPKRPVPYFPGQKSRWAISWWECEREYRTTLHAVIGSKGQGSAVTLLVRSLIHQDAQPFVPSEGIFILEVPIFVISASAWTPYLYGLHTMAPMNATAPYVHILIWTLLGECETPYWLQGLLYAQKVCEHLGRVQ